MTIPTLSRAPFVLLIVAVLTAGCVVNQRPVEVPSTSDAIVLVGSAALPIPIDGLARHPWISLRERGGQRWERWEVMCCPQPVSAS